MDKVKILHSGDLHFDTPFQGLTSMKAEIRREDLRETFGRIIDMVKSQNIPILLLAGDIFDNDGVTKMTMEYIDKKFREIPNTQVFIAPGNHDYYSPRSFYAIYPWPQNVHIFIDKIEKVFLSDLNTCIYGIGFVKNHERQCLIKDFHVEDESLLNIMVLHGDVIGSGQTSDYNPIFHSIIENSGLDYLALGHKHEFSGIKKTGQTHWAYCGSPEGRGFDELGVKGIIKGEVSKNRCELEFVDISKRRYYEVGVGISELITYEDIIKRIREQTKDEERQKNLYKIILQGEIDKDISIYPSVLEDKLNEDFFFIKILDETSTLLNYVELEQEYSLKGIYLRKIRERIKASQDVEERKLLELALRMGFSVLDKGKVDME